MQARVEKSEINVDRENARATIRIVVVEGPQFKVGGVDMTGNSLLPQEEIRKRILLKSGDVFSRGKLRDSVTGITDLYSAIGRASADVNPNTMQDTPNRLVNVVFEIVEGPETYVERINISGNTRSEEKILRREIPMAEGDLFTSQKLARAKQRLTNLNYFDKVEAKTAPGSAKDKIVVNIDVTEKPTGLFSIGGGYSSQDGVLGTLDLSQRNFLGKGWEVFLRLRGGENLQTGTIGFTEPWLFDRPLAAGFDLFNTRRILTDYTVELAGRRHPARPPHRGVLPLERHLPGQPGHDQRRERAGQPAAARAGGHPPHVPDRGEPHPRHPRQHLRPDPGRHRLDRPGLRGGGVRRAIRPEHLQHDLLPAAPLAGARAELPLHGRLPGRLGQ